MPGHLSAIDAFFVAYQQSAGIPMHLGVELELRGPIDRARLLGALEAVLARWPAAASRAEAGAAGLRWGRPGEAAGLLREAGPGFDARNEMIDVFHTPAMQLHWSAEGERHRLSLRAHHALFDGEGFMAAAMYFVDSLAAGAPAPLLVPGGAAGRRWPGAGALLRGLRARARVEPYAAAPVGEAGPGPVARCAAGLSRGAGPWRVAAAWMRALGGWAGGERPVALEMPMSLRRWMRDPLAAGNHVAPMIYREQVGGALDELAGRLRATARGAVERGEHRVEPLLTWPGRWLPWGLFRAAASSPTATGNATGHLAFLRLPFEPAGRVARRSGGALELVSWEPFTPVCLRMGAALLAIETPESARLTLIYRRRAVSDEQARGLLSRCAGELQPARGSGGSTHS